MNHIERIEFDMDASKIKIDAAYAEMEKIIADYNARNCKVVSVTPLISGYSYYDDTAKQSYGYGYGHTSGMIIIFEEL